MSWTDKLPPRPGPLRPALEWPTRVRLWAEMALTRVGGWLIDHGHHRAAVGLWRACGLWDAHRTGRARPRPDIRIRIDPGGRIHLTHTHRRTLVVEVTDDRQPAGWHWCWVTVPAAAETDITPGKEAS